VVTSRGPLTTDQGQQPECPLDFEVLQPDTDGAFSVAEGSELELPSRRSRLTGLREVTFDLPELAMITATQTAPEVFEQTFLLVRARILEIAATLDRLDRAEAAESVRSDARFDQIRQGLEILLSEGFHRAAQIQEIFSDPYDPTWMKKYLQTGERPALSPRVPH
jgi:hypothetical protein